MLIWGFYCKRLIPENEIKFRALFPSIVTFLTFKRITPLSSVWSVGRITWAMWLNHSFGFKGKLWKYELKISRERERQIKLGGMIRGDYFNYFSFFYCLCAGYYRCLMPKPSGICNAESGLLMISCEKAANLPSSNDIRRSKRENSFKLKSKTHFLFF